LVLLRREGWMINLKRVRRLYDLEGLSLRLKKIKKRVSALRIVPPPAQQPNERWSMDFMSDALHDGRRFRVFTIVVKHAKQQYSFLNRLAALVRMTET
jgi:putative transposase